MIRYLKPSLPPIHQYVQYLEKIWETAQLTNNGPLVVELEDKLKEYLGVNHLRLVSSGTTALQIAINALELKGEIITTAFSHLSTINAILWQNCTPILVDIEAETLCIDPGKIEEAITKNTCAILATHVYGYPCHVELITHIARKYNLKVIFDGAQSFAVKLNKESIFKSGDISIISFNATKIFHTIEGGAIITNDETIDQKCSEIRNFGLSKELPDKLGINGKNSEIHAAMGLCNLTNVQAYITKNKEIAQIYKSVLINLPLRFPVYQEEVDYNYSYFPIIFDEKDKAETIRIELNKRGIYTKKYFSPSLNHLPYTNTVACPVSESVSESVLCLPIYHDLSHEHAHQIASLIVTLLKDMV